MDRTTVNAHLRAQFFPLLAAEGFTRKGDVARRVLDGGVVHVVDLQHQPRRHLFQVNLGAHLLGLGGVAGAEAPEIERFRDHDCAWRGGIVSGFRNADDAEFAWGATDEEARESVAFLVSEWPRQSEAFFRPYAAYPDTFLDAACEALTTLPHPATMLTWARVARMAGEDDLSRRLASAALPRVPERATSLRASLKRIAE
ncbi:DUF4304 domain-containing protein [Microbacterium resistens]